MIRFPVIRKTDDFSRPCKPVAGIKELHDYCRTLPRPSKSTADEDVLQDECGLPILDEVRGDTILDDFKPIGQVVDNGLFNDRCPNPVFDSLLDEALQPVLDELSGDVIVDDLE